MASRLGVLGRLQVLDRAGSPVPLGGSKPQALLAALLLHHGKTLSTERLVDLLWDGEPPAGGATTLRTYIGNVRQVLLAGGGGAELHSVARGEYRLALTDPDVLDAERFRSLMDEGLAQAATGRHLAGESLLEQALHLWRGPALDGLDRPAWAESSLAELEELRLVAWEALLDCRLAVGHHDQAVLEAQQLVDSHPFRERFTVQLMLALYRCGRQADALSVAAETKRLLADELGLDAGPELTQLETSMLRHDATLSAAPKQTIRFCTTADGVSIAYAVHGNGPPLLVNSCWLSHLQHDWDSPVWRHFLEDLGRIATVIRFDERGHGMSDWDVADFGPAARLADIEAVADDIGLDRFALLAMSQGGPPAIDFAVKHPDRVTRLVFYGCNPAALPDPTEEDLELSRTLLQMIKVGWGRTDSVFRRVFTSLMIPNANQEQMGWLDELQRVSVSPENAYLSRKQALEGDARHLLDQISAPTLVLHSRGDRMIAFSHGRALAKGIRNARLVPLDSDNHIVLEDEPAWSVFLHELEQFLSADRETGASRVPA